MRDLEPFDKIAREEMLERHRDEGGRGYTYYHSRRVMQLAQQLASSDECRGKNADVEIMSIAALFHDVGRDINPDDHCAAGREFVVKSLAPLLSNDELERVALIVLRHNRPVNIESEIIHDADLIDHCGAMDAWRLFCYYARHHGNQYDALKYFDENKGKWLAKHVEWAIFETARAEIRRRLDFEARFIEELRRELNCEFPVRIENE
jgi:putative nucleotidyltransferase with HDIG domain